MIKDDEKRIYAYKREDNMHEIIIILNNDLKTHDIRIEIEEGIYKDVLNEKEYTINKSKFLILNLLKAKQGIILVREK
ncbi:MAG: alpha amylase C-terminal domain-containing protein [Candidatus Aenigmatarchaeota archaeon]